MASFMNENPLQKLGLLLSGIASTTSRDPRYLQTNLVMQDAFQEMRDREQAQQQDQQQRDILAKLVSPQFIGTPATKAFQVNGRTVGQNAPAQVMQTTPDAQLRALAQMPGFREAALSKLLSQRFAPPARNVALGVKDRLVNSATGETVVDAAQTGDEMTPWQRSQIDIQERRLAAQEERANEQERLRSEAENRRNRPQATGYVSAKTGNPLRYAPDTQSYMDGDNVVDPSELVAAGDFNKELTNAREVSAGILRAQNVKKLVEDNKSAFEKNKVNQARLKSNIPFVGEQIANAVFTPEEQKVRAAVSRDAAQIINELYGAALSAGESGRAQGFTPGENDTLEMLLPKLDAAVEWAAQKEKALLPGAVSKARAQLGVKSEPAVQAQQRPKDAPADAKPAKNGKWYSPDPLRPGKYIEW